MDHNHHLIIKVVMINIQHLQKWVKFLPFLIIDFSQYPQEVRNPSSSIFSQPPRYPSAPYPPYYEPKSYANPSADPMSYDPTSMPSSFPDFSAPHSTGPYPSYSKEPEPTKTSSPFPSFGRGFSNPIYSGFYNEPSYSIFISNLL